MFKIRATSRTHNGNTEHIVTIGLHQSPPLICFMAASADHARQMAEDLFRTITEHGPDEAMISA